MKLASNETCWQLQICNYVVRAKYLAGFLVCRFVAWCLQIGGAVRIVSWLNCLLPSGYYTLPNAQAAGRLPSCRGSRTPARVALACCLLVLVHATVEARSHRSLVAGSRSSAPAVRPTSLRSKLIKSSSSDLACRRRQQTTAMLRDWCRCAAGRQPRSVLRANRRLGPNSCTVPGKMQVSVCCTAEAAAS